MKKIKLWLVNQFLPTWAREELLEANEKLRFENTRLREELRERDAYISGLEAGMRAQRKIIINTGEAKK